MPGPRRQEAALGTREAAFGSRNPRRLVFLHAGSVDPDHLLLGAVTLAIGCRLGDHLDEVDPAPGGVCFYGVATTDAGRILIVLLLEA